MFAGGSGTKEDPYLIETREHLENITGGNYYKQISDIDLSEEAWAPLEVYENWIKYNGQNYEIRNMTLTGADYQGFFSEVTIEGDTTVFENMSFVNTTWEIPNESCSHTIIGTLAGSIDFNASETLIIENCHSKGFSASGEIDNIVGEIFEHISGLIGALWTNFDETILIKNCSVDSTLKGSRFVGGLFGLIEFYGDNGSLEIKQCYANTTIVDSGTSCPGWVEGLSLFIGGIPVWNVGNTILIEDCYGTGSLSAHENEDYIDEDSWAMIAGFVGFIMNDYDPTEITIKNCYSVCKFNNIKEEYWHYNDDRDYKHRAYGLICSKDAMDGWAYYPNIQEINVINSYFDETVGGEESGDWDDEGRTTEEMSDPPAENTYVDWEFGDQPSHLDDDYNDFYPALRDTVNGIWWFPGLGMSGQINGQSFVFLGIPYNVFVKVDGVWIPADTFGKDETFIGTEVFVKASGAWQRIQG